MAAWTRSSEFFSTRHERRHKDQIHPYSNTIDAAVVMYERDYISLEGLYHVTLQSCMDLLRLLRRGVYQHKAWRKEYGQALIDEYQNSVDEVRLRGRPGLGRGLWP